MTLPAIGEMVHYATEEGLITGAWQPACRAALVIEHLDGDTALFGVFDRHGMNVLAAVYDPAKARDTWHWPEHRSSLITTPPRS